MDIQLNFINASNDANNSQIVIFQKNVTPGYGEIAVAWKVIQNCGQSCHHPFAFPMTMQVGCEDSYGNFTPLQDATNQQVFAMRRASSGDVLVYVDDSGPATEVQVQNQLPAGAINTGIYKNGNLLAVKTAVAPGQMGAFQFKPTIWIGVASQVVQGAVMNSAIVSTVNTELNLLGIASADIVMTGGGPGTDSTQFKFTLQNVVNA